MSETTLDALGVERVQIRLSALQTEDRALRKDLPLVEPDAIEATRQKRALLEDLKRRSFDPDMERRMPVQHSATLAALEERIGLPERVEARLHELKREIARLSALLPKPDPVEAFRAWGRGER